MFYINGVISNSVKSYCCIDTFLKIVYGIPNFAIIVLPATRSCKIIIITGFSNLLSAKAEDRRFWEGLVQSQIDSMKCPKCGIEGDGKFCQDCGTKLTVKAKVVLCPGKDDDDNPCNVELSSEQKFCKNCGHSVDQAWFWSGKCGNCGAPCPEGQNLCATCITAHTSDKNYGDISCPGCLRMGPEWEEFKHHFPYGPACISALTGIVSGTVSGYVYVNYGKTIAIITGITAICFMVAYGLDYVKINWQRIARYLKIGIEWLFSVISQNIKLTCVLGIWFAVGLCVTVALCEFIAANPYPGRYPGRLPA